MTKGHLELVIPNSSVFVILVSSFGFTFMGFLVPLTLFSWIPFCIFLFLVLPPRRAVIWSFLLAWLFLPMAGYSVPGLPDYTKMSATTLGVLIGAALFDSDRLLSFRLRWVDIPMILFCTTPLVSSYLTG